MKTSIQISQKGWDLNAPLTVGVMFKMWEEVFFPTLLQTFVTKEELAIAFDRFEVRMDQKIEKRVRPLEKRMDRLEKKMDLGFAQINEQFVQINGQLHEMREEMSDMKDSLNSLKDEFHEHARRQEDTEELRVEHLRRLNAKVFPSLADKLRGKKYGI